MFSLTIKESRDSPMFLKMYLFVYFQICSVMTDYLIINELPDWERAWSSKKKSMSIPEFQDKESPMSPRTLKQTTRASWNLLKIGTNSN